MRVRTRRFGEVKRRRRRRVLGHALHHGRFGPLPGRPTGFTLALVRQGQHPLDLLPLSVHESHGLTTAPHRSGLQRSTAPTTPSADFCPAIRGPCGTLSPTRDAAQISRGKLDHLPCTPAGSTAVALGGSGLRDRELARPTTTASYPVSVRRAAGLLHASSEPRLATTPLRFASTSHPPCCAEDSHLQVVEHARHAPTGRPSRASRDVRPAVIRG